MNINLQTKFTITYPPRNLDHIYNKHQLQLADIEPILHSPDLISRVGQNVKYYYKDNLVAIVSRENKKGKWKLTTAYPNEKEFIMGSIIWQKED